MHEFNPQNLHLKKKKKRLKKPHSFPVKNETQVSAIKKSYFTKTSVSPVNNCKSDKVITTCNNIQAMIAIRVLQIYCH